MKKVIILVVCALFTLATYAQTSEFFNRMDTYTYKDGSWTNRATSSDTDYIITLDMDKHTLLITRSSDKLRMEFIQVMTFVNKRSGATLTGLLVAEDRSTYPICGDIYMESIEINFGELIYKFYNVRYNENKL